MRFGNPDYFNILWLFILLVGFLVWSHKKKKELLEVFWRSQDPTTLNRQGPDIGEQYRSVIFFHDFYQELTAKESKKKLEVSGHFVQPIVTEIVCRSEFYRAEEYHQRYLEKNGLVRCHK